MYAALGIIAALCIFLVYVMRKARKDGRNEANLTFSQDTLKAIRDAKDAQDNVIIDITERERVRRKYDNA